MHATTFIAVLVLLLALLVAPLAAEAQEAGKIARIGMLASSPSDSDPFLEAFKLIDAGVENPTSGRLRLPGRRPDLGRARL